MHEFTFSLCFDFQGNDKIHALTQTNQKLSIYMRKWDGSDATADYSIFEVASESEKYQLTVSCRLHESLNCEIPQLLGF